MMVMMMMIVRFMMNICYFSDVLKFIVVYENENE
jgi:hypothetical protein